MISRNKKIFFVGLMILVFANTVIADDTMLMFVGEDLEVLSIASRKEESALSAPAIARVITQKDIRNLNAQTISSAINNVAGFHIEETNKGSIPYLRGIPNSALVLYDTVPIGSGADKFDHVIDYETSLAPVKRIEIIKGAGSVLWGPDAFAGVVNIVPLTGKDFTGYKTGVSMSFADQGKEAFLNYGKNSGQWSSFFSLSARHAREDDTRMNVAKFWNDGVTPTPVDQRFEKNTPDYSQYFDFYGNVGFSDWLVVSAKLSGSQKAFSVTDWNQTYTWEEQKSYSSKVFKLEASKDLDLNSAIRFTGYYSSTDLKKTFIDQEFDQIESSMFAETIYERSLFTSEGLLTLGVSYKKDDFNDILVWDSFFPGYFVPENEYYLPGFVKKDYDNSLFSIFGQYRHKIGDIEAWIGFRNDNHKQFEDKTSFNTGFVWTFSPGLIFKTNYGSGYRTPFAKQIVSATTGNLEQIKTINFQVQYKLDKKNLFSLTLFRNNIDNHVMGDRYEGAGISLPNSQTIDGVELEWEFDLGSNLLFSANASFLTNNGSDDVFLFNDYTYIDDDGNEQKHYQTLTHPYDAGPDIKLFFNAVWKITDNIKFIPTLEYYSERKLYYSVANEIRTYPHVWLCNLHLRLENIKSCDIDLFVNNVFNSQYKVFDAVSDQRSASWNAGISITYKW